MNRERPVSEFARMVPELIKDGQTVSFYPKGSSMNPVIKEGDSVTLASFDKLRKYDIVLFLKDGEKAILHRVVKVNNDKTYVMQGDSKAVKEFGITEENVVAKVIFINKKDKKIKTSGIFFYVRSFLILHLRYIKRALKF